MVINKEDYFQQGKRSWFRLHEKGGKLHDVPAHHKAEEHVDAYIAAAGIAEEKTTPLFRTIDRHGHLTDRRLHRNDVLAMSKEEPGEPDSPTPFAVIPSGRPVSRHILRQTGHWNMLSVSLPTPRPERRSSMTGPGMR